MGPLTSPQAQSHLGDSLSTPQAILEPIATPTPTRVAAPLGLGGGLQNAWQGATVRSPDPVAFASSPAASPRKSPQTSPRTPRGASPEELGQANRRLFRAFAT